MPVVVRASGRRVALPRLLRVERDGQEVVLLRHGEPSLLEDKGASAFFAELDKARRLADEAAPPPTPVEAAQRRLQAIDAVRRRLAAGGRP